MPAWPDSGWPVGAWPDGGWPFDLEASVPPASLPEPTHARMAYEDFEVVGTWAVREWSCSEGEFTLRLEEPKGSLKKKIPLEFYDRATFPNIAQDAIGKPIPRCYGRIYDVEPVCIDTTARTFKVAGHAICDITGCRVYDGTSETWRDVVLVSADEPNGEFTLAAEDWDGEARVAVDLIGMPDADGNPMDNWSDVLDDLLRYVGEGDATIDTVAFAAARAALLLGTDSDLVPVYRTRVSLDVRETEELFRIASRVNAAVGAYLQTDFEGRYRLDVFEPIPGESAPLFDDASIKSFREEADATEIVSRVRAEYQFRAAQEYPQVTIHDRAEAQHLQGASSAVLREFDPPLPLDRTEDAEYVAQRTAAMEGEPRRLWKALLSHRAWTLRPGQFIRVEWTRGGISAVFEVLEVRRNLTRPVWIEVLLGDLHGLGDSIGWLAEDDPVFPDRLGGGDCSTWDPGWTAAQKTWARQNVLYVTDDNGFADPADPDSRCGKVA